MARVIISLEEHLKSLDFKKEAEGLKSKVQELENKIDKLELLIRVLNNDIPGQIREAAFNNGLVVDINDEIEINTQNYEEVQRVKNLAMTFEPIFETDDRLPETKGADLENWLTKFGPGTREIQRNQDQEDQDTTSS